MRKVGEDKKGQQMTLGTIIVIVLGIVVLVFLIYGFSKGWNNLWSKVTNLGGGDVNTNTIKTACALSCSQKDVYGFCEQKRTVMVEDNYKAIATCKQLTKPVSFSAGKGGKSHSISVGVEPCNIC